jgi:hypothetical protein
MKIFENSKAGHSTRRASACGYCRKSGHTKRDCPHAKEDWVHLQKRHIPVDTTNIMHHHWFKRPKYWGEWYTKCHEMVVYQNSLPKKGTKSIRSAPKCGFCGDASHNRRNCDEMQKFLKLCKKANENYRKAVHKYVVKELGLDIGAAIELSQTCGYGISEKVETHIGLITYINWDKVNVMSTFKGNWDTNAKYGQDFIVNALVDGAEQQVCISGFVSKDSILLSLITNTGGRWHSKKLSKIIGKSEAPLPDDWATSYNDAWDYLVKKRSIHKLDEDGVSRHIESWARKDI